mmetsp:Transcript_6975/g.17444  ORF Transcript_6975/g.17444 Transcript_6975/m.17444 type:complete len:92 (-) Transcript_6975:14-289(-)
MPAFATAPLAEVPSLLPRNMETGSSYPSQGLGTVCTVQLLLYSSSVSCCTSDERLPALHKRLHCKHLQKPYSRLRAARAAQLQHNLQKLGT